MPPSFTPRHKAPRDPTWQRLNDRSRGSAAARGYDADWRRLRLVVLEAEPICRRCGEQLAVLVDHIVPLEVAPDRRLDRDNLQPLCRDCHAIKTWQDLAEYRVPGARIDKRLFWPRGLKPSRSPLALVCGAPGAGKSTWVRAQRSGEDIVIDLDEIAGTRHRDDEALAAALARRNAMLMDLARGSPAVWAWFVLSAPGAGERGVWERQLEPRRVVVLETPLETCLVRLDGDPQRQAACRRWWKRYAPRPGDEIVAPPG